MYEKQLAICRKGIGKLLFGPESSSGALRNAHLLYKGTTYSNGDTVQVWAIEKKNSKGQVMSPDNLPCHNCYIASCYCVLTYHLVMDLSVLVLWLHQQWSAEINKISHSIRSLFSLTDSWELSSGIQANVYFVYPSQAFFPRIKFDIDYCDTLLMTWRLQISKGNSTTSLNFIGLKHSFL